MTEKLLKRGEAIAAAAREQKLAQVAGRLRSLLGSAAVHVDGAHVRASGRGMVRRWLVDPSLRFLAGGTK